MWLFSNTNYIGANWKQIPWDKLEGKFFSRVHTIKFLLKIQFLSNILNLTPLVLHNIGSGCIHLNYLLGLQQLLQSVVVIAGVVWSSKMTTWSATVFTCTRFNCLLGARLTPSLSWSTGWPTHSMWSIVSALSLTLTITLERLGGPGTWRPFPDQHRWQPMFDEEGSILHKHWYTWYRYWPGWGPSFVLSNKRRYNDGTDPVWWKFANGFFIHLESKSEFNTIVTSCVCVLKITRRTFVGFTNIVRSTRSWSWWWSSDFTLASSVVVGW